MPKVLLILKKNLLSIILLSVIFALLGLYLITLKEKNDLLKPSNSSVAIIQESKTVELSFSKLELAKSQSQQEEGLMNRLELCDSCGMLFIFEKPQELTFWMKNTFISLDIIFMNENGKILSISKNAIPLNQIERYRSNGVAKYALETNAGFSDKNNLSIGDKIDIEKLKNTGVKYEESSSSPVQFFI